MVRFITPAAVLFALLGSASHAQDTPLQEYIRAFSGRWICDTVADQDIEGYTKKGEKIRTVIVYTPMDDGSGLRQEWHLEKDGIVRGRAHGITAWDAATETVRNYGTATGGFHVEGTHTKQGNEWHSTSVLTFPDGSKATSKAITSFSDGGDTRTVVVSNRVSHEGKKLQDLTDVWKRVSKNHEMLDKHLGWLIGDWTGQVPTADQGEVDADATYKWIADKQVIALDLKIGEWKGLSMIFFDPSDEKIKMWGANSAGGNGQAVMRVEGNELVWTNVVFGGDGKKNVSEFSYMKKDGGKSLIVKFEADGETFEIVNTRK